MKLKNNSFFVYGVIFILLIILFFVYLNINHISLSLNNSEKSTLTYDEQDWLKEQGKLIFAADRNAPPLRFVDKADNQYKGVVVDYINVLSIDLGINIETHPLLWEDALSSLSEGKTDVCDMFRSKEREKHFLFTNPIYILRAVLVVRNEYKKNGDIGSMSVATPKGDYANEYLIDTYPTINLVYVSDVEAAVELLVEGKVDAVAGDEPVVLYEMKKNHYESLLRIIEEPLYENEVVLAVPKSKPELITILNKGIKSIERTDQLALIQQKWFGISTPIVQLENYSKIIILVIIIAGILVFFLINMSIWNSLLKRQVEKRTKEVMNSKNDLQITFDGMTEYLTVINLDYTVLNINESFLKFLGNTKENINNKHCKELFKEFNENNICKMVNSTIKEEKYFEQEISCNTQYYVIRTYPLNDTATGKLKNILVIIENVTKEKITERQMFQANKMSAIGQLAAGMGHEIRNPLGIIRNHSFILRQMFKDDKAFKSLDYIDSSVERANKIINNLLEFSRLTDDTKKWFNLYQLISKILELEHKTLINNNIEYQFQCDENLRFFSNEESLKHILINLISNAVDAIDENGIIIIKVMVNNYGITLSIKDSGEGIPKDEIEKIFNPFYSTKIPGEGTGLGLYIVYNEIKKLNGDILVKSEINVGTLFEIYLPFDLEEKNEQIDKDINR